LDLDLDLGHLSTAAPSYLPVTLLLLLSIPPLSVPVRSPFFDRLPQPLPYVVSIDIPKIQILAEEKNTTEAVIAVAKGCAG
jgi:hypothetical protein